MNLLETSPQPTQLTGQAPLDVIRAPTGSGQRPIARRSLIPGVRQRPPGGHRGTPCPQPPVPDDGGTSPVGRRVAVVLMWESDSPTTVPPPPSRGRPSAKHPGPGLAAPACRRLPPMAWQLFMLVRNVDLPRDIVDRGSRGRSAIRKDNRKHSPSGHLRSTVKFAPKTAALGSRDRCTNMVRPRHRASNATVSPGAPNVVQWIAITSERREVPAVLAARASPAMGLEVQEVRPTETPRQTGTVYLPATTVTPTGVALRPKRAETAARGPGPLVGLVPRCQIPTMQIIPSNA